jgi:hypothetical protein
LAVAVAVAEGEEEGAVAEGEEEGAGAEGEEEGAGAEVEAVAGEVESMPPSLS